MNTSIVPKQNNSIVMPAVTADQAVEAFHAYQELAKRIITPDDVQNIQGKEFKKKSFWRKCQRFFNLSIELREEKRTEDKNGVFSYKFVFRAKAPNKAYMDGTGTCSSNEKGLIKTEHNTRAIAETRAKNRAIADLVAFGEVSAEEVNGEVHLASQDANKCPECGTSGKYHSKNCKLQQPIPAEEYGEMIQKQENCSHEDKSVLVVKKEGKNNGRKFEKCNQCGMFLKFVDETVEENI